MDILKDKQTEITSLVNESYEEIKRKGNHKNI